MSLINRAEIKRKMLLYAHEHQNPHFHKYERISKSAYDYLETRLLLTMKELVDDQRRGITIKP
jgi:predicted RNase H-like nuclease